MDATARGFDWPEELLLSLSVHGGTISADYGSRWTGILTRQRVDDARLVEYATARLPDSAILPLAVVGFLDVGRDVLVDIRFQDSHLSWEWVQVPTAGGGLLPLRICAHTQGEARTRLVDIAVTAPPGRHEETLRYAAQGLKSLLGRVLGG